MNPGLRLAAGLRAVREEQLDAVRVAPARGCHERRVAGLAAAVAEGCRGDAVRAREQGEHAFRQNVACFRLYRLRFLQENMRFAAFFKIYQII